MSFNIECLTRESFEKAVGFCQEHNLPWECWGFTLELYSLKDQERVASFISGKMMTPKVVTLLKDGRFLRTVRIESYGDPSEDFLAAIAAAGIEDPSGITLSR